MLSPVAILRLQLHGATHTLDGDLGQWPASKRAMCLIPSMLAICPDAEKIRTEGAAEARGIHVKGTLLGQGDANQPVRVLKHDGPIRIE